MQNKYFLFDLDGTLINTALDFEATINHFRVLNKLMPLALQDIMPEVNRGAVAMTQQAFSVVNTAANFDVLKAQFLTEYTQKIGHYSALYQGLDALIKSFEHNQHPWGIVTNKPRQYAELYMQAFQLTPSILVCGDDVENPKPHPEALLKAAAAIGYPTDQFIYAGDHERDIQAGNAANMHTVAATYGYLTHADNPETWGATTSVSSSLGLAKLAYTLTQPAHSNGENI